MGVDQLLVDPVPAAHRQLLDTDLACREHHLAQRAVEHVAVDVDVRKVVVGADLLELAQRVLQRAPVPQADVLERVLVGGRICRLGARIRRERALRDAVESVRLSRERDVVRDVRRLAHELVRLDDEAVDVPGDEAESEIQRGRWQRRSHEPPRPRRHERTDDREARASEQRNGHAQRPEERDVRVSVGNARKDRVVVHQAFEAAEIPLDREHHQQKRPRQGEAARAGAGPFDAAPSRGHLSGA